MVTVWYDVIFVDSILYYNISVLDLALWAAKILKLNVFLCSLKNAYTVVNWFSGKLVKLVSPDSDFKGKMHQFYFRWGSAPDPAGGAYSTPPDPFAIFKGAYF